MPDRDPAHPSDKGAAEAVDGPGAAGDARRGPAPAAGRSADLAADAPPSPEPRPEPPIPPLRRLPPLLRRAWYSLNQAFRRRVSHLGITPDQFTVLRWLYEDDAGGMTQRALADLMASDPNTVTSVLARMEAAELIERKPHATDRRAKLVRLRPRGKRVFAEARRIAIDLQTEVMASLPARRRERFLADLETVADAARDALEES